MVYICERRFTGRTQPKTSVRLYSNCERVILKLNGEEIPLEKRENHIFVSGTIALKAGVNHVESLAYQGDKQLEDKVVCYYLLEN